MTRRWCKRAYLMDILKRSIVVFKRERSIFNRFSIFNNVTIIFFVFRIIFLILFNWYYLISLICSPYFLAMFKFLISLMNFLKSWTISPLLFFIPCPHLKTRSGYQKRVVIFGFQKSDFHCDISTFRGRIVVTIFLVVCGIPPKNAMNSTRIKFCLLIMQMNKCNTSKYAWWNKRNRRQSNMVRQGQGLYQSIKLQYL